MHALEKNTPAIHYWKSKTVTERLQAAFYLNSIAYDFNLSSPPKLDRTVFSMRKNNS